MATDVVRLAIFLSGGIKDDCDHVTSWFILISDFYICVIAKKAFLRRNC